MSEKTYSEDEYNTVLAKVTNLEAKVTELTSATEASAIDAAVAAARAELETQITDLQSKLDAAVLEATAASADRNSVVAWLEAEVEAALVAAELASRKEDRITRVKEVASFPDDYLEANADRFTALSDEAFEAALEDWKTIAPKKAKSAKDEIPSATAMTASRTNTDHTPNVLSEVMDFRFQGVDTRTV